MGDEPGHMGDEAVVAKHSDQAGRGGSDSESLAVSPGEAVTARPASEKSPQAGTVSAEVTAQDSEVSGDPQPSQGNAVAQTESGPQLDWYILKVQSNREKSIAEALQRRGAVAGLQDFLGQVIVPTEVVTEFKGGKKRTVHRKLYPGYILVEMQITDDTWFLIRETPGIGDFTGSGGKPTPMLPHEVQRIISKQEEKSDKTPKLKISFNVNDRVKINEGTFQNFEGEVSALDHASGRVTVMINIFGRSTPVELEYWQVELV